MSVDALYDLLQILPTRRYENEAAFVIDAIPQFVRLLGYSSENLLFEHRLTHGRRYIADAIVTFSSSNRPRLLIEAKTRQLTDHLASDAEHQLRNYFAAAQPDFAVLLSPNVIWILQGNSFDRFNLLSLSRHDAETIFSLLSRPPNWHPRSSSGETPSSSANPITFKYFSVDRARLVKSIADVSGAQSNDEKGTSLEDLAQLLFEGIRGIRVKYRRLLCASSELDLVLEYNRKSCTPAIDEFGRYSIVECKNWAIPVGAKHVRDFKVKLEKCRVTLGFLLARNGITGEHDGADALRELHSYVDRDGIFIAVITLDDICAILDGADLHQIIDDKIDRLRFDL